MMGMNLNTVSTNIGVPAIRRGARIRRMSGMAAKRPDGREVRNAREVQRMMLPHRGCRLDTLEYAGCYRPIRAVGGDHFDFLDLGAGQVALLVADISGKSLPAALLMANLQACFRTQTAATFRALPELIQSVNGCFYESSLPEYYATVFVGTYNDAGRRLVYANCGHVAALLLRATGRAEWLSSTARAVGMFREMDCPTRTVEFSPGDTIVIYTDGISEAENRNHEEFGATRLEQTVIALRELQAAQLSEAIVQRALDFSGGFVHDDMTVVVARATA